MDKIAPILSLSLSAPCNSPIISSDKMARGGGVIFKKTNGNSGGRKRKARSNDDGDDEEDEEYVLGEDEEVEESESDYEFDVNSRNLSDEESFEFSDDDEDGEEFKIARSKKKKQRNPKKSWVSDDEMEDLNLSVPKKRGRGRQRKQESRDSDFELDDEDDDDEDFSPDEDDFDEDEVSIFSKRKVGVKNVGKQRRSKVSKRKGTTKRSKVSVPARKRRKTMIEGSDDDFIVKGRVSVGREQTVSKKVRKKKSDSDSMDSDFVISDDDFVEKDLVAINKRRKNSNKVKKTVRSKGQRKKRSVEDSEPSDSDFVISDGDGDDDEDDDLYVKNRVILDKQQKKGNKVKKTVVSKGTRKKIALEDSEPSDSDFVISDDDDEDGDDDEDVKDQFMLEKQQKKSNKVILDKQQKKSNKVKKTVGSKGRRRKIALEDSEQSDSDFLISDDDYEDGDDDEDVKDQFMLEKEQKKSNKVKKMAGSRGRKKRSVEDSVSSDFDFMISDDDDEFDVKDQVVVYKQQVNKKKEKAVSFNKGRRRKRSSSDLGSSDSDYLISEEDDEYVLKDQAVLDELRKKSKKLRKRRTEPMGRRRSSSLVDSDSESFDYDDVISEEEVRDLRIGWHSNQEQPKRITAGKKEEEKGNEKKAKSDSGKQVCGICLSEEKKSVVQGLLNCCFHYFCFACIMEWSKVESRCPVCKRRFEMITKSGSLEPGFRMRGAVIRVQKRDQVYQPSEEELRGMLDPYEHVVCMECQQGRDDNLMLLCDICDSSAHTYCVGLGREVPEGNWFCECCRSVSDGQDQMSGVAVPDQEPSQLTSARVSTNSPRPASMFGRSSSLRIDLNSSPRDFPGEEFVSSPISGSGASTVSGRRHIRQRIHVILSTNRQRQTSAGTNTFRSNSASDIAHNGDPLPISDTRYPLSSLSSFEQWQQNPRPFFHSHPNLAPCMFTEGSSLRHVDGAKEEVQHMVKSHLKILSRNRLLERSAFEEIARKSTHTILAACGIEHQRSMVSASAEPPDNCTHHSDDGPAHLLKGCCSSCFSFFVKDVVQRLVNTAAS